MTIARGFRYKLEPLPEQEGLFRQCGHCARAVHVADLCGLRCSRCQKPREPSELHLRQLRPLRSRRHQRGDQHPTAVEHTVAGRGGCASAACRSVNWTRPHSLRKSPAFTAGKMLTPVIRQVRRCCGASIRSLPRPTGRKLNPEPPEQLGWDHSRPDALRRSPGAGRGEPRAGPGLMATG